MALIKFNSSKRPRRCWSIAGYPEDGKSTFATALSGPFMVIDADHRWDEMIRSGAVEADSVYTLSETAEDHCSVVKIDNILRRDLPGSGVKTLIVDSLTSIIKPMTARATLAADGITANGDAPRNKSSVFKEKAVAMSLLSDAINFVGCDFLFVWHLQDGSFNGQDRTTETITETERDRLDRILNLSLELVCERDRQGLITKRGIRVLWSRSGKSGMTLWDAPGNLWRGMPERIEAAVYATAAPVVTPQVAAPARQVTETSVPASSGATHADPSPATTARHPRAEAAINDAVTEGRFANYEAAASEWDRVKTEKKPGSLNAMLALWCTAQAA